MDELTLPTAFTPDQLEEMRGLVLRARTTHPQNDGRGQFLDNLGRRLNEYCGYARPRTGTGG